MSDLLGIATGHWWCVHPPSLLFRSLGSRFRLVPAARRLRKAGTEVGAYVLILQCDTDFPSLEQVLLDRDLDQGTSVRRSELAGDAAIPVSSLFTTALGTSL